MMGTQAEPERLFYDFCLDEHVPQDHLLRQVDRFLDLSEVRRELQPFYSHIGRPSIDPELMIRMLIVGYCLAIRSERLADCSAVDCRARQLLWYDHAERLGEQRDISRRLRHDLAVGIDRARLARADAHAATTPPLQNDRLPQAEFEMAESGNELPERTWQHEIHVQ